MRVVVASAAVAAAAGIALSVYGIVAPPYIHPPTPPSSQEQVAVGRPAVSVGPRPAPKAATVHTSVSHSKAIALRTGPGRTIRATQPHKHRATVPRRSAPAHIALAAVGISSKLGPARGLKPNGTVADAPLSGPTWSLPWWYSGGPAPGQQGSAVILGHVDSAVGAGHLGVFFKIGALRPGEEITVTLADGLTTRWTITSATLYVDGTFPNALVYDRAGPPTLRLVTCGGKFDWQTHEYDSATVVTARPLSSR